MDFPHKKLRIQAEKETDAELTKWNGLMGRRREREREREREIKGIHTNR